SRLYISMLPACDGAGGGSERAGISAGAAFVLPELMAGLAAPGADPLRSEGASEMLLQALISSTPATLTLAVRP
ncbi:hypothetical protein, partial [Undibacterium luofuense]